MSVYYVFQGETYKEEHTGGYVWSPQLDTAGHKNAGYTMMTNIKEGDFILHNENGKVVAISVAQTDCYKASQPKELSQADTTIKWDDEGYRIDTDYFEFDVPLFTANYKDWLEKNYIDGSAFTRVGRGKQQYMCSLADEHAIFLIEKAINLQKDRDVLSYLKGALADIVGDKESEYDQVEMEAINEAIEEADSHANVEWSGKREKQAMTTSSKTGRAIPKRDPQRAADSLAYADYLCEYSRSDRTFTRKNGKQYTEPHHLIPISKYRDFEYSVDVMENIVSLCSHCHNLLHYSRFEEKVPLLTKLYSDRKTALETCGLVLTLEQLLSYYK
ncbi:HNH endonuclease [Dehalococcoides mccartyi]|uniref:HNH endonuclease n=1 Tax=Dehalococcoides mccartyi TaxID=61435 RepID=A0AB33HS77_9CHLR|nr:HNH endonuclease [Dehalococcoides mccartyi]BAZ97517.1 HNH endonuclease [Dehalococcoides mccartyi]